MFIRKVAVTVGMVCGIGCDFKQGLIVVIVRTWHHTGYILFFIILSAPHGQPAMQPGRRQHHVTRSTVRTRREHLTVMVCDFGCDFKRGLVAVFSAEQLQMT